MDFITQWILLASMQAAATISPGPAFAVLVRNALTHGRMCGIYTAAGLALGVAIYVALVIMGFTVIIAQSETALTIIRYLGAGYLIYIGVMGLLSRKKEQIKQKKGRAFSGFNAFWHATLMQILNPKALIFFTAVYAQFITPETSGLELLIFGMTSALIEFGWWALLAVFLTTEKIRTKFTALSHWIDRITGGLLVVLGVKLAITRT